MKLESIQISPVNIEERKKLGIRAGDTVRVWVKIQEKDKTRLQAFEGLVLSRKHGDEPGGTFTVRKVASGVGVERVFPLFSPAIDKIEIIKRSRVRRSKLYFIREKATREIRRQMRKMNILNLSTESGMATEADRIKQAEEDKLKEEENQKIQENEQSKETEEAVVENSEEKSAETEDKKEN